MKKSILNKINRALRMESDADGILQNALHDILRDKGLTEEEQEGFRVCFASGNENVVHYMQETLDIDLETLDEMTLEDIRVRISEDRRI